MDDGVNHSDTRSVFCTQGTDTTLVDSGRNLPGAIKWKQKTDKARTQQSKKRKGIHCTQVQPENNIRIKVKSKMSVSQLSPMLISKISRVTGNLTVSYTWSFFFTNR